MMNNKSQFIAFILVVLLTFLGVQAATAVDTGSPEPAMLQGASGILSSSSASSQEERHAPMACPALGGYANSLEQPNYCVYYNTPPTTNAEAALVEDYVDDYWDRYSVDYGFNAPLFTPPKLEVRIENFSSCNGSAWQNHIKVYDGCFSGTNPEFMQYVTGHEIFHRVQFAHDPDWATTWTNSSWIYEGTARNMEDVAFANIDTWANCLGVPFSYCDEVNDFLANTNADLTSHARRYEANLFWTYFREQFGTILTEPQRGVDAILEVWDQMFSAESVSAVNNALAVLAPGTSFNEVFRQFVVANWTKDLNGVPDASYNYADEDQIGNPAPYGPLVPANGGVIDTVTPASWTSQYVVKYGARYYAATPDPSDCPVITADYQRTGGSTEFYHVVTQNGATLNTHVEGSGTSWTQSFINDGITKVVAIIGGQSNSATVDVTLSCTTPIIDIELPNTLAPDYVGPFGAPDDMVVQVSVTNGSPTGPVVSGLTNTDFQAEVGGLPALITGGGFVQEEYFLLVNTPIQSVNGPYDLEIFLEEPGTTTVIASDLETDAVVYDSTDTDLVIITDVSGSMGNNDKLLAAKDAANLFIDASNSSEGLGLVSYDHDVVDTLAIQFATLPHRNAAHTQVNNYTDGGATSIGDGLNEAVTLLGASPTGNARCQFTLLSDGMENSSLYWADVQAAVVATGCPVMSVAFGSTSNELLMQDIATATGGVSYYNDVFVSSQESPDQSPDDTELDLGSTYLDALCEAQGCERLLLEQGIANTFLEIFTYTLTVDDSITQLDVVLDWAPRIVNGQNAPSASAFALGLTSPSGTSFTTPDFEDEFAGHVGYHVDDPEDGNWTLFVLYANEISNRKFQVVASGQTDIGVKLLLPAVQQFATGDYFPLYAIWQPGGGVTGTVTAPNGMTTMVPLFDDGEHGDGQADDGWYGGLYTLATQALEVQPEDEGLPNPPVPFDEGAYRVHLLAKAGRMRREEIGSFAVPEGNDGDMDGVPDAFINTHCPSAPNSDADLDFLDCSDEYFAGTDPNNSDSDSGGECDGSEVIFNGLDPLDPADDEIEALDHAQTIAQNGSVRLSYDVKPEYIAMLAHRATDASGPWNLHIPGLPTTGTYTDTNNVVNETEYFYCLQGRDSFNHWSAVLCTEAVTPRVDPVPPMAGVLINGGAGTTEDSDVLISFVASDEEHETSLSGEESAFDDIAEMLISNDPSMVGASWQPFQQNFAWQLVPGVGFRTVYVRFKDLNGNESAGTETATIFLDGSAIYLPLIQRN
jgi:hypothetical protein